MSFAKIAALVMLSLTATAGIAVAQTSDDDSSHHPAAQAAPPAAMPMGPSGPGGASSMPSMMGNMMQMMPTMCSSMMQGASAAPGMGRGMKWGGMGLTHAPFRHIEGVLAFYKAELAITESQMPEWSAFADAVRAGAKLPEQAGMMPEPGKGTALEQMQRRAEFLSAQLEALKLVQAAAAPLYATLSADQKKTADALMAEHLERM